MRVSEDKSVSMRAIVAGIAFALLSGIAETYSWAQAPGSGAGQASVEGHAVPSVTTIPVSLGSKTVNAVHAQSEADRRQGLLGWSRISDDDGMLLDFVTEGNYAIHMQGMQFPIDAVWLDNQGVVKLVYKDITPNSGQVYPSMFACRYCLELKAGFCARYGVKIGGRVTFGQR